MLLSKGVATQLNLVACRFKQYYAAMLRKEGIDLTPEQLLVLDILWNEGEMTQQSIADNMGKDKNSITKLVDALEVKGLVIRRKDDDDRRANLIMLTDSGLSIKSKTKQFGIAMLDRILDGISDDELNAFLGTLTKMSDNMK